MDLAQIKTLIKEANFSEDSLKELEKLLEQAERNGGFTAEERALAQEIVERELIEVEQEAKILLRISDIVSETNKNIGKIGDDMLNKLSDLEDKYIEDLNKEEKKIKEQSSFSSMS